MGAPGSALKVMVSVRAVSRLSRHNLMVQGLPKVTVQRFGLIAWIVII